MKKHSRIISLFIFLFAFIASASAAPLNYAGHGPLGRPSVNGKLHVEGTLLKDSLGNEVILRGPSTHGLTWYPEFINRDLFKQVSVDWHANLIRLAMYSKDYCEGHQKESLKLLKQGIQYAIDADMYVMVDWHILEDNNPNDNLPQALEFFNMIAKEYANVPNVIFEICNEPNGDATWEDIKEYVSLIIPVIRKYNPQALVLIGTPDFDREIESPAKDPVPFENVMYSFHFYASSHKEDFRVRLKNVVAQGTPIYITECGLSEHTGDGATEYDEIRHWYALMDTLHLSYAIWSLSNKDESSAFLKSDKKFSGTLQDEDLTPVGAFSKELFQGHDPYKIVVQESTTSQFKLIARTQPHILWLLFAGLSLVLILIFFIVYGLTRLIKNKRGQGYDELLKRAGRTTKSHGKKARQIFGSKCILIISSFCTLVYLCWRCFCSLPFAYGTLAVTCSSVLLAVEILGFIESLIHYYSMLGYREHPLPKIDDSEYPDVDIFVSTYNEPTELLKKTLNGCKGMAYPDKSKVHIYLCDDHRRPEMRALAGELGVNYFDRPNNEGAKAGNLNAALARTNSPYIVTFDADMIPRREFLLQTIPYFVDAEKINASLPEKEQLHLGLLQTPQSFYTPDVFQHSLYAETEVPNEQDFFYRSIEAARTASNSVIYGGSNTILSRKALDSIGGFYTKSITEDFATGMRIEAAGFASLGLSTPLASGIAPASFKEHVQQRTRWGRGVIATAKQLKFWKNKDLSNAQKLSYLSSVMYWYSPIKNLIYLLSPLMFAVLCIPVFKCSIADLALFWLPMHILQTLCLRVISSGTMSSRWSGIYETSVMPFLLLPIIKETFGITLSTFKVTKKDAHPTSKTIDKGSLIPFAILAILTGVGIVQMLYLLIAYKYIGILAVLFWLFRNMFYLIMSMFLCLGRDSDGENVNVYDAEDILATTGNSKEFTGITTKLTEHSVAIFADEPRAFRLGESLTLKILSTAHPTTVKGTIVHVKQPANESIPSVYTVEILAFSDRDEYIQLLYDRVPTLPQRIRSGLGLRDILWRNITSRLAAKSYR